jgi:hypothetical protein
MALPKARRNADARAAQEGAQSRVESRYTAPVRETWSLVEDSWRAALIRLGSR